MKTSHEPVTCDAALSRVFEFLGKRWNGVILGTLAAGPVGFASLARGVTGISDSMLSERLTGLSRLGLVLRTVVPGPPISVTYGLTDSGQALMPALNELIRWAQTNLGDPSPCEGQH